MAYFKPVAYLFCFWIASFTLISSAQAAHMPASSFEPVGDAVLPPSGWIQFCRDWAADCPKQTLEGRDVVLDDFAWKTLNRINRYGNEVIAPITDLDHYGRLEYWTYPYDLKGDCEDYILFKRKALMDLGWPQQALLITVVVTEKGEGHAILIVKTDRGEYALDNLRDEIRPWSATGYRFVKRQTQENPNAWVSLGNNDASLVSLAR